MNPYPVCLSIPPLKPPPPPPHPHTGFLPGAEGGGSWEQGGGVKFSEQEVKRVTHRVGVHGRC